MDRDPAGRYTYLMASTRESFRSPKNLSELLATMAEAGDDAVIIAGGQSLLPTLTRAAVPRVCLIDVAQVVEMRKITIAADHVELGAAANFSDILASEIGKVLPALAQALRGVGTFTIRNRATVGGSLAWADPRAQLPLVLLIHDTVVRTSRRELSMDDFILGSFKTALLEGEVITAVRVRHTDHAERRFAQLLDRNSAGRAIISVAQSRCITDGEETLRIAVAGLADRPVRSDALRLGKQSSTESRAQAVAKWLISVGHAGPLLDDPFHSARYRQAMAGVLLRRLDCEGPR
jgi:CO/xanthine dehydrogenase FAD-binding subunit